MDSKNQISNSPLDETYARWELRICEARLGVAKEYAKVIAARKKVLAKPSETNLAKLERSLLVHRMSVATLDMYQEMYATKVTESRIREEMYVSNVQS